MKTRRTAYFDDLFGPMMPGDWFPSPAHVMRRKAILDFFESFPPGSLLEMGCGAGRFLADWGRLGHAGEAIDLDPIARDLAKDCVSRFGLDFIIGSQRPDRIFDYLVCTEVLEHLDDPEGALADWLQSLKPGGHLLVTVPAFQHKWGTSDEWAGHVQRFEPEAFEDLLRDQGLKILHSKLYGFPIGEIIRMAGNVTSARKMASRSTPLDRQEATLASGRDRSIEQKLEPLMRSWSGRTILRASIALQRHFNRGHGLLVVARKQGAK